MRALGRDSLEIYCAHTIASAGARIGLLKLLHVADPMAHLVVGTAAGLLLPVALAWACRQAGVDWLFRLPRRHRVAA